MKKFQVVAAVLAIIKLINFMWCRKREDTTSANKFFIFERSFFAFQIQSQTHLIWKPWQYGTKGGENAHLLLNIHFKSHKIFYLYAKKLSLEFENWIKCLVKKFLIAGKNFSLLFGMAETLRCTNELHSKSFIFRTPKKTKNNINTANFLTHKGNAFVR